MLPGSGNVGHVFVQDIFLGADAVILDVLGPVQLAHVEVKRLQKQSGQVQTACSTLIGHQVEQEAGV